MYLTLGRCYLEIAASDGAHSLIHTLATSTGTDGHTCVLQSFNMFDVRACFENSSIACADRWTVFAFIFIGRMWNFTSRPWWRFVCGWRSIGQRSNKLQMGAQTRKRTLTSSFGHAHASVYLRLLRSLLTTVQAYRWWKKKHVNCCPQLLLNVNLPPPFFYSSQTLSRTYGSAWSICMEEVAAPNLSTEIVVMRAEARFAYTFPNRLHACMRRCTAYERSTGAEETNADDCFFVLSILLSGYFISPGLRLWLIAIR